MVRLAGCSRNYTLKRLTGRAAGGLTRTTARLFPVRSSRYGQLRRSDFGAAAPGGFTSLPHQNAQIPIITIARSEHPLKQEAILRPAGKLERFAQAPVPKTLGFVGKETS